MNKIQNKEDVIEWARAVVAANGEKFTPLSKREQYCIAKVILAMMDSNASIEEWDAPPSLTEGASHKKDVRLVMRVLEYHQRRTDVQQAYDDFLAWCNTHPQGKEVMDFSTGHKSIDAAFAYWLCEPIQA